MSLVYNLHKRWFFGAVGRIVFALSEAPSSFLFSAHSTVLRTESEVSLRSEAPLRVLSPPVGERPPHLFS